MLPSAQLRMLLDDLDSLHGGAGVSIQQQNYYEKLALIELCGWIEQSVDEMAKAYCSGIRDSSELDKILKRIHGFDYDNLRSIMIQIIGISHVLDVEDSLMNQGVSYQVLTTQLKSLTKKRNDAAHTHIPGVQITYDSPSSIIAELNQLEPALKDLESELSKY
jgi:hypothetical protein